MTLYTPNVVLLTIIISVICAALALLLVLLWRRHRHEDTVGDEKYAYLNTEEVIALNALVTNRDNLLRDGPGLESALNRPQTSAYYEQADISRQTALLIEGIALNHPFIDGNKRTALLSGVTFLDINRYRLTRHARRVAGQRVEQLVISHDIDRFTKWLRSQVRRKKNTQ